MKHSKACIHYSFWLNLLLHALNSFILNKLMIWSARKQYYLGFLAFLEFKLVKILIITGVYFSHSVDIISTCYFMKIGENDSAHQLSKMLHASSKFELRSTLTNYWNHFSTKHPTSRLYLIIGPLHWGGGGGNY